MIARQEGGDAVNVSVVAGVAAVAPARGSPGQSKRIALDQARHPPSPVGRRGGCGPCLGTVLAVAEFHHLYFNRHSLPDLGPFTRFEFPTIGHVYDSGGRPLIELAREYREITRYEDIPPIVRDAILAAEDKRFFSHNGIDYFSLPRVVGKIRVGTLAGRLVRGGPHDEVGRGALFPQGGSTITQQLVRGSFLRRETTQENSYQLRHTGLVARTLSSVMGARGVNMLARKREEMRLSLWLEQEMRKRFGSKRRAKEEILARYASFGTWATVSTDSQGRQNTILAGSSRPSPSMMPTKPRCSPELPNRLATTRRAPRTRAIVLRRRNQTLTLMRSERVRIARGSGARQGPPASDRAPRQTPDAPGTGRRRACPSGVPSPPRRPQCGRSSAGPDPVYATADARVQHIVNEALEHGLGLLRASDIRKPER